MPNITDILNSQIMSISIENLGLFLAIIFITLVIRSIVMHILDKKITSMVRKTQTDFDDLTLNAARSPISYLILLQGFYAAIGTLHLTSIGLIDVQGIVHKTYVLIFSFILLYFVFKFIDVVGHYIFKVAGRTDSKLDDQLAPLVVKSLRIFVLVMGILFILQNFGYNIASLLAGLGIGGLAFALAAQDTVSNLFGSFTIFADKPLHVGDWIRIGDTEGTVEEIGFRSTRIRRFDQALVSVPNSQFIKSEVTNFSAMKKRRIKFNLGVSYGTTRDKMTRVVEGIKEIIREDQRFDHSFYMVRFTDFGEYSLNIFIYCFTRTTVWDEFLQVREEFNLKIMQLLEELDVEIAFPSQTIYLERT